MTTKPQYYKVMWHNCVRCRTHYTSDVPHVRAYLCDECWSSIPHYSVKNIKKVTRGPTYNKNDIDWKQIALYTLGNICCLIVIGYYLWIK